MVWLGGGLLVLLLVGLLAPVRLQVRTVVDGAALLTAEVRWLLLGRRLELNLGARAHAALRHLLARATEDRPGPDPVDTSRLRLWQRWLRRRLGGAAAAARCLLPRLRVEGLVLLAEVGAGDAMVTALACGGIWAFLAQALGALATRVPLPEQAVQVVVRPRFGPPGLKAMAELRLRVRALDLVRAGWRAWRSAAGRSAAGRRS